MNPSIFGYVQMGERKREGEREGRERGEGEEWQEEREEGIKRKRH